jgi:DNA-binding NarL/FixJ family response regulator
MRRPGIILADGQELIRIALRQLLTNGGHYEVLAEASHEDELLGKLQNQAGELVILDYSQEGHFQCETIGKIKALAPKTSVVIISSDLRKENIFQVLENGISGFVTKHCSSEEIVDAVQAALKGEKFFCTKVIDILLAKSLGKEEEESCEPIPLSPREIEIVRFAAKGLIAKEIADVLNLSLHTVYTHRKNIMKKLQLNSSSELVLYAVNKGLVNDVLV